MRFAKSLMLGAGIAALSAGLAAAAPAVSEADLNVRAGPGTEYEVVGVIPAGSRVDVAGCTGSWCQVNFRGGRGYASASYLQVGGNVGSAGVAVETAPAYGGGYAYEEYDSGPSYGSYDPGYGYDEGYGYYGGGVGVGVTVGS
ncbi:MAG TPA: SH3 domain-containing protein, partial [Xanthobacteraceae bacterium]